MTDRRNGKDGQHMRATEELPGQLCFSFAHCRPHHHRRIGFTSGPGFSPSQASGSDARTTTNLRVPSGAPHHHWPAR
jgi:hypothetical protein